MDMGSFQSEFHVVPQEFNQFVNHLPLQNTSQMHRVKGWLKWTNLHPILMCSLPRNWLKYKKISMEQERVYRLNPDSVYSVLSQIQHRGSFMKSNGYKNRIQL